MNAERKRLEETVARQKPWRQWGSYLSERQWGTVREDYSPDGNAWDYFPHDMARSRAYRWGEDGIAGLCDDKQRLCLALALWNGNDPILKERLFGLTNSALEGRKVEVLRFVALEERRFDLVHTLSGGMRHRVSLALSLLHEPDILFLDEPTVGVDPELRASFWDNFGKLKESGKTVVITTHYMDEAKHCDRIGLMHRGRMVAEGIPADVVREVDAADLEEAFLKLASRDVGRSVR